MNGLRRWGPSLGIFIAMQAIAAIWIAFEVYRTAVPGAIAHTLGGPLNLLLRLDRLWRYGEFPREVLFVALLAGIALLPWAHVWRPRRAMLAVSLLGSVLWAASGFLFSIDHL